MGYKKVPFGSLKIYHEDTYFSIPIPKNPTCSGDIPTYVQGDRIAFGQANSNRDLIYWIKPDHLPIFVADRVLLKAISYDNLVEQGYAGEGTACGSTIYFNGIPFCCRLLDVGTNLITSNLVGPNEWDTCLKTAGDSDSLWHWHGIKFWGGDAVKNQNPDMVMRPVRGFGAAASFSIKTSYYSANDVGFRPVVEPLESTALCKYKEVILDGQLFCVVQHKVKGTDKVRFRPALYPQRIFSGNGGTHFDEMLLTPENGKLVKMYTVLMGGEPVRQDSEKGVFYKRGAEITLTDHYYGDEYLVPWVIHNGCAYAAKDILMRVSIDELVKQGYLP